MMVRALTKLISITLLLALAITALQSSNTPSAQSVRYTAQNGTSAPTTSAQPLLRQLPSPNNGSGETQRVPSAPPFRRPPAWSPQGRRRSKHHNNSQRRTNTHRHPPY